MDYRRMAKVSRVLLVVTLVLVVMPQGASAQGKRSALASTALSVEGSGNFWRLNIRPAGLGDPTGALWRAENTALGLIAAFGDRGFRLGDGADPRLEFALAAWTSDGTTERIGPALPRVEGNRLEYLRPGSTETVVNRADGLAVTIAVAGPATLFEFDVVAGSGVAAVIEERALRLRPAIGEGGDDLMVRLVEARDATGPLNAAFTFDRIEQRLRIEVDGGTSGSVTLALVISRDNVLRPPAEDNYLEGFARSVAVDGDLMVVGSPDDDALGAASGAAWLFRLDQASGAWEVIAKLTASDGAPFDYFGSTVALWDGIAVVGAPWHDGEAEDCGAVYVFEAGNGGVEWRQTARLEASQAVELDWFGAALAIDREAGNTIIVGAPSDGYHGPSIGAVFLFERTAGGGWAEVAAHRAEVDFTGGSFGMAVAIDGNTAAVGADHRLSDRSDRRGSIHMFRRDPDGWALTGSFISPLGHTGDAFGTVLAFDDDVLVTRSKGLVIVLARSGSENWDLVDWVSQGWSQHPNFQLDIVGDTIIVGQSNASPNGIGSGEVKVYNIADDQLQLTAVLSSLNSIPWLGFGASLAIDRGGTRLVAGASAAGQNAVWVFDLETGGDWLETCQLDPPPSPSSRFQSFGKALASDGRFVLVGAPNAQSSPKQSGPGRAYLLEQNSGETWSIVARFEEERILASAQFGSDVSLSGDHAAVLAPHDAAYVYAREADGEWRFDVRLPIPVDDEDNPRCPCGTSVAISGTTLAVGRLGVVAVYEWNGGWHETTTLRGEEQDSYFFGAAVAIENDTLVVGSPWKPGSDYPPPPPRRASVQVFLRHSGGVWGRMAVLTAPDEAVGTGFGEAVALSEGTIVVAAHETDSTAILAGAAFVFEFDGDGWRRVAELVPGHAVRATRACSAVAVDGDYVLCGSPWATAGELDHRSGTVTVFERHRGGANAWGEMSILEWEGAAGEQFGTSVAVLQRQVWVGVPGDDGVGEDSGAVVTYEITNEAPRHPSGRIQ